MKRGKEVLGLPVIAVDRATRIGTISDLVMAPSRRAVVALLVSDGGRGGPAKYIPFESILRIGPHAVMIETESAAVPAPERPEAQMLCAGPGHFTGLQVLTQDGRTVGTVCDILLDEHSGLIRGYQISAGHLRDVVSGRITIPASAPVAIGEEYMIVPESAVISRRAQLEQGPPLVVEVPPADLMRVPVESMDELAAEMVIRQEDLIIGRLSRKTIANEDAGGVICFRGEPIREETVQKAKAAGKFNELVEAAREAAAQAASLGLADQYAQVAVGRMAAATVRTPQGEVIVGQGDVVTHQVVDRARRAGVLDQLMGASRTPEWESADRWAGRRDAAQALWEQIGGRLGQLTRRR